MMRKLIIVVIAAACGEAPRMGVAVRDSAGIRIVDNGSPTWQKGSGWRVDPKPALSIGVTEGDPRYQLFRVYDALRLPDGRIVVSNSGSHEVRFYDSSGTHLRSTGRQGEGPGEYSRYTNMPTWRQPNGEIVVVDDDGRVHVYSEAGDFLRTVRLRPPPERRPPRPSR